MADNSSGISGMGDNDSGALTPEQQSHLNDVKIRTRLENELYLRSHPQISHVLQIFLKEVLTKRPTNIRQFAAEYFSDKDLREKVQEQNLETYLRNFEQPSPLDTTST